MIRAGHTLLIAIFVCFIGRAKPLYASAAWAWMPPVWCAAPMPRRQHSNALLCQLSIVVPTLPYPPSALQFWMLSLLARCSAQRRVSLSESWLRLIDCDHIVASVGAMKEKYSCILIRSAAGQRITETHEINWRQSAQILEVRNRDHLRFAYSSTIFPLSRPNSTATHALLPN